MAVYVLDSNFFIEAHRVTYPIDIAVSFWSKVKSLAEQGKIMSIDKVRDELYDKNDELEKWCKDNLPETFFQDSSSSLAAYSQVCLWADSMSSHYTPKAIQSFLSATEADAFLIGFVLQEVSNRVLVTHEVSAPNKTSIVKIPDCCNALKVPYSKTIDMFRNLGETF